MLINEREELYNSIQLLGNEPGMESSITKGGKSSFPRKKMK
jgi:hypothetical protein